MEEETSQKMTGKIRRRRIIPVAMMTTMIQCSQLTGFNDRKPELIDRATSFISVDSTCALLIEEIWACNRAISCDTTVFPNSQQMIFSKIPIMTFIIK